MKGPAQPDGAEGDVGAVVACEPLKAPMSAILGFAELMRAGLSDGLPAERMDALAQAIARSGEQVLRMIAAAEAGPAVAPEASSDGGDRR